MLKRKLRWYGTIGLVVMLAFILPLFAACGTAVTEEEEEEPAAEKTITEEPAAAEEPATTAGGPPNIPAGHTTAGCPVCHEQGIGGAPKWPDSHVGYTEQMCTSCHQKAE